MQNQDVIPNEPPPDLRGFPAEALDDVRVDDLPFGADYGDVIIDADPSYLQGETVSVTFYSGNPRLSHDVRNSRLSLLRFGFHKFPKFPKNIIDPLGIE